MFDPILREALQDPRWWEEGSAWTIRQPLQWWLTARRLMRAGELLWERAGAELQTRAVAQAQADREGRRLLEGDDYDPDLAPASMMLFGFALENIAKGLIVARDPDTAESVLCSHLSLELAERTGLEFSDAEKHTIEGLGVFVLWAGRYAVPKPRGAGKYAASVWAVTTKYGTDDAARVDAIWQRLVVALATQLGYGRPQASA